MLQPKVISVVPNANYTLTVEYENGEKRLFDTKPYISGDWFGKLNKKTKESAFSFHSRRLGRS